MLVNLNPIVFPAMDAMPGANRSTPMLVETTTRSRCKVPWRDEIENDTVSPVSCFVAVPQAESVMKNAVNGFSENAGTSSRHLVGAFHRKPVPNSYMLHDDMART